MGVLNNWWIEKLVFYWLGKTRKSSKAFYKECTARIQNADKHGRIFLMNTPEYANLGDQLIAIGELAFFHKNFPDKPIYEITQNHLIVDWEGIQKVIREDDLVLVTGGGYFGNLWEYADSLVQKIVRGVLCSVIILPQTVFYTNDTQGVESRRIATKVYEQKHNVYAIARDVASYEIFKDFVGTDRCLLVPDMALYAMEIIPLSVRTRRKKILLCFRSDKESVLSEAIKHEIQTYTEQMGYEVDKIDTVLTNNIMYRENRYAEVMKMATIIGECSLLITDRLHAMIFAIMTNTPCIVFDNVSGKVSGVYQVLMKHNQIRNVFMFGLEQKNLDQIQTVMRDILNGNDTKINEINLNHMYQQLIDLIKEIICYE